MMRKRSIFMYAIMTIFFLFLLTGFASATDWTHYQKTKEMNATSDFGLNTTNVSRTILINFSSYIGIYGGFFPIQPLFIDNKIIFFRNSTNNRPEMVLYNITNDNLFSYLSSSSDLTNKLVRGVASYDLDNDGTKEIIILQQQNISIWNIQGDKFNYEKFLNISFQFQYTTYNDNRGYNGNLVCGDFLNGTCFMVDGVGTIHIFNYTQEIYSIIDLGNSHLFPASTSIASSFGIMENVADDSRLEIVVPIFENEVGNPTYEDIVIINETSVFTNSKAYRFNIQSYAEMPIQSIGSALIGVIVKAEDLDNDGKKEFGVGLIKWSGGQIIVGGTVDQITNGTSKFLILDDIDNNLALQYSRVYLTRQLSNPDYRGCPNLLDFAFYDYDNDGIKEVIIMSNKKDEQVNIVGLYCSLYYSDFDYEVDVVDGGRASTYAWFMPNQGLFAGNIQVLNDSKIIYGSGILERGSNQTLNEIYFNGLNITSDPLYPMQIVGDKNNSAIIFDQYFNQVDYYYPDYFPSFSPNITLPNNSLPYLLLHLNQLSQPYGCVKVNTPLIIEPQAYDLENDTIYYAYKCFAGDNLSAFTTNKTAICTYSVFGNYNISISVNDTAGNGIDYRTAYYPKLITVSDEDCTCGYVDNSLCFPYKIVNPRNINEGILPDIYYGMKGFLNHSFSPMYIFLFCCFLIGFIIGLFALMGKLLSVGRR